MISTISASSVASSDARFLDTSSFSGVIRDAITESMLGFVSGAAVRNTHTRCFFSAISCSFASIYPSPPTIIPTCRLGSPGNRSCILSLICVMVMACPWMSPDSTWTISSFIFNRFTEPLFSCGSEGPSSVSPTTNSIGRLRMVSICRSKNTGSLMTQRHRCRSTPNSPLFFADTTIAAFPA